MITLIIDDIEMFDSHREEFLTLKGGKFRFDHTLKSVSSWEAETKKPFLTSDLDVEDLRTYFVHMCLDEGLTRTHITSEVFNTLSAYIKDTRTATTFSRPNQDGGNVTSLKTITSEVLYSMMIDAGIPFEAENWNLNRLLVLMEIISIKSKSDNKMPLDDIYKQNRDLNEERKRRLNTKG